jgi:hypothetical protein
MSGSGSELSKEIVPLGRAATELAMPMASCIPSHLAQRFIPARVAGDPLGFGLKRQPAPPDPDDLLSAAEKLEMEKNYTRGFLSEKEKQEIAEEDKWGIDDVRYEFREMSGEKDSYEFDPQQVLHVDARIDFKVFFYNGECYSREQLYHAYPIQAFGGQPETLFDQLEIEVYAQSAEGQELSLVEEPEDAPRTEQVLNKGHLPYKQKVEYEYIIREVRENLIPRRIHPVDFIRLNAAKEAQFNPYAPKRVTEFVPRKYIRTVLTKFYVAGPMWKGFISLMEHTRTFLALRNQQLAVQGKVSGILALLDGTQSETEASSP